DDAIQDDDIGRLDELGVAGEIENATFDALLGAMLLDERGRRPSYAGESSTFVARVAPRRSSSRCSAPMPPPISRTVPSLGATASASASVVASSPRRRRRRRSRAASFSVNGSAPRGGQQVTRRV